MASEGIEGVFILCQSKGHKDDLKCQTARVGINTDCEKERSLSTFGTISHEVYQPPKGRSYIL